MLLYICTFAQNLKTSSDTLPVFPVSAKDTNSVLTFQIIDAPNSTFCYDIFNNGGLIVHQPSIPALPGNEGFKTKADAEKVAKLVISKIKKGEMPPTVTVKEMQELKVIK
jgi:hypothetical protein